MDAAKARLPAHGAQRKQNDRRRAAPPAPASGPGQSERQTHQSNGHREIERSGECLQNFRDTEKHSDPTTSHQHSGSARPLGIGRCICMLAALIVSSAPEAISWMSRGEYRWQTALHSEWRARYALNKSSRLEGAEGESPI